MDYIDSRISKPDDVYLLTAPCDMPLILENLKHLPHVSQHKHQVCVAKDSHRIQPLVALIPMTLRDHLAQFLESGQRKVEQWILDTNPHLVDLSKYSHCFYNVNDQTELEKLEQQIISQDN